MLLYRKIAVVTQKMGYVDNWSVGPTRRISKKDKIQRKVKEIDEKVLIKVLDSKKE